jgi:hypothetical protein
MSTFHERRVRLPVDADGPDFAWLYDGAAPSYYCFGGCECRGTPFNPPDQIPEALTEGLS